MNLFSFSMYTTTTVYNYGPTIFPFWRILDFNVNIALSNGSLFFYRWFLEDKTQEPVVKLVTKLSPITSVYGLITVENSWLKILCRTFGLHINISRSHWTNWSFFKKILPFPYIKIQNRCIVSGILPNKTNFNQHFLKPVKQHLLSSPQTNHQTQMTNRKCFSSKKEC